MLKSVTLENLKQASAPSKTRENRNERIYAASQLAVTHPNCLMGMTPSKSLAGPVALVSINSTAAPSKER